MCVIINTVGSDCKDPSFSEAVSSNCLCIDHGHPKGMFLS